MKKYIMIIVLCLLCKISLAIIKNGYTDKLSYRPGETVTFFLNGNSLFTSFPIVSLSGTTVATVNFTDLGPQTPVSNYWENGFGYTASSATWIIPNNQESGMYLLNTNDDADAPIQIIVKAPLNVDGSVHADIIVVVPTNTDEAYNTFQGQNTTYGAHSFYDDDPNRTSTLYSSNYSVLSFLRPNQSHGRDDYIGFLNWFKAANYALVYPVNMISDMDMDNWDEIKNAKLLIIIGHSEYWTRKARINFDRFVDQGGDAMVLSGNAMYWQVRYQIDPNNANNTQMVCFKSDQHGHTDDDGTQECEPLLKTINYWEPLSKYSILGSIGADSHFGFLGNYSSCWGGNNGHKIILDNSPVLAGTSLHNGDYIACPTGEYDETLIKNANATSGYLPVGTDPILDMEALGFYRAELIGYDISNHDFFANATGKVRYAPFMVFQKNCTSGKIFNVSSNHWCRSESFSSTQLAAYDGAAGNCATATLLVTPAGTTIQKITSNMIDLLYIHHNDEAHHPVFTVQTPPSAFNILPATPSNGTPPVTVSYQITQHGSIDITPCGVTLTDDCATACSYPIHTGFKVEKNDGSFEASIIDCASARMASHSNQNSSNASGANSLSDSYKINVFPNPTTGSFNLFISDNKIGADITIFNLLDQTVWQKINTKESSFTIDLSNQPKGLYMIRVVRDGQVSTCKLISL